jgi:DNA helicase IV
VLRKGYRVPAAVVEFAGRLLPVIAPGVAPPEPVRSNPGRLDVTRADGELRAAVSTAARDAAAREGSLGVIVADDAVPDMAAALDAAGLDYGHLADDARITLVPATLAKGLEYDHVVVVEPAAIVAAEPAGLRRLYVVLTRAVSSLTVVHAEPLPDPLTHQ